MNWLDKYKGLTFPNLKMEGIVYFAFYSGIVVVISGAAIWFIGKYPIKIFQEAIEKSKKAFFGSKYRKTHLEASETAMTFHAVKTNQAMAIDHWLSSSSAKLVTQNRFNHPSIVATVLHVENKYLLLGQFGGQF